MLQVHLILLSLDNMAIPESVKQAIARRKAEGVKKKGGRPPQWLFPESVEREYRRKLFDYVDILQESFRDTLLNQLPSLHKQANSNTNNDSVRYDPWVIKQDFAFTRTDDWARDLNNLISATTVIFNRRAPQPETLATDAGLATSNFNRQQFDRVTQAALGVNVLIQEPNLQTQLNAFAFRNADLIKDISDKTVKDISVITSNGLTQGKALSEIESEIQSRFPMAKRRAQIIARDQVATLNGQLTKNRQTDLGIQKFRWITAGDERVRSEHSSLGGKVFSWDKLPAIGAPGTPILCRCRAEPIFDGFE
jgi:SPP1 gp7 family putative phage head morphogenesis protein